MKRIVTVVVLVVLAAIAGIVARSSSKGEMRQLVSQKSGDVRENVRQSYELAPGARVELIGLNGSVNVETSDSKTAEVSIERTASSQEALDRRRVLIESNP